MALCCALANNPEVQKKAQIELDAAIGPNRLPLISDRTELPYLNAVVKELARWYTPAPIGTTRILFVILLPNSLPTKRSYI